MTDTAKSFLEKIAELNPDAKSADGLEDAIIGIASRAGAEHVLAYSYEKCVEVLMKRDGMEREEATEYLDFNTIQAYVGTGTPVFIDTEV